MSRVDEQRLPYLDQEKRFREDQGEEVQAEELHQDLQFEPAGAHEIQSGYGPKQGNKSGVPGDQGV